MKNLAYVYDHRFYKKNNNIYSSGAFTKSVWNRFLKGFDSITVFSTILSDDKIDETKLNRVDVPNVCFEHIPYVSSAYDYLEHLFVANKKLSNKLRDFDAVIVRVPGRHSINAFWVAKKNNIPVGVEVVGCPWDAAWNYGSIKGKITAPIAFYRMKKLLKNATHSLYVTKHFLQNRYPTKGKNTSASNVEIEIPKSEILRRRQSKIERIKNEFKIGLMGSLDVKYKGHKELLYAIADFKKESPDITVSLVGPGDSQWVKDLVSDLDIEYQIEIKGKLPSGAPIMKWLDSLDLYVHPSKQEGLPRSVIEAMSRGCPILASSVGGIPELIDPKYLHEPGNSSELAEHLKSTIINKNELMKMSRTNYKRASEYDYSKLEDKRIQFWNSFSDEI